MVAEPGDPRAQGALGARGEAARVVQTAVRATARARKNQMDSYAIRNAHLGTAILAAAYAARQFQIAMLLV